MIPRQVASTLQRLAQGFPVLAITGPRQSSKTTLARAVFATKPYVSLENPQEREFALTDPQRFLARQRRLRGGCGVCNTAGAASHRDQIRQYFCIRLAASDPQMVWHGRYAPTAAANY